MISWHLKLFKVMVYLKTLLSLHSYKKVSRKGELAILKYFRDLAEKTPRPKDAHYKIIQHKKFKGLYINNMNYKTDQALLYLHSGGYVLCTANSELAMAHYLSLYSNIDVYSLDYRLAPEHPFPCALEDALNAYYFLLEEGYSPNNIIIAGLSAGGGLALATMLKLRDENTHSLLPSCAVCFSPWIDLASASETQHSDHENDFLIKSIDYEFRKKWPSMYLGKTNPCHPYASPYYAELFGLPPVFIQTSKDEILYPSIMRFVEKAQLQGVYIELDVWKSMPHGWQALAEILPESRQAIQKATDYVKTCLYKFDE